MPQSPPPDIKPVITFEGEVAHELNKIKTLLVQKNEAYGDSALDPVRIFADPSIPASLMIAIRIDDKLSRLARGSALDEDVVNDLLGYIVLLRIAEKRERAADIRERAGAEPRVDQIRSTTGRPIP